MAGAIAATVRRAQDLVSRLASSLVQLATSIWRAAAARLAALWQAVQAAARAALQAAGRVGQLIGRALTTVADIVKLLSSKVLQTIFEAMRDPQGKVVAPITAMAAPLAANVPPGMEAKTQQHIDAGIPTSEAPVVQRQAPTAAPAPPGEGFFAGVWRHVQAAGSHFAAHWGEILAKVVLGILLWFPMIAEEGPKLWEECKGVVNGGGGVDRLDHVLGVLRHLMNIVAGTLATVGVWAMLFAWAGTPIAEAATIAAYEALSMQVLAADVALAVVEMGKAWFSSTRPGVAPQTRELYLERFTGSLISTVIAGVMFALGAIAARLAKAFRLRTAGAVAGAGADAPPVRPGERPPGPHPEVPTPRRGAPLTADEVANGVRMAKDLPGGGRLRLLADGRLVVCHSPCQAIAARFQRELRLGTPETDAFQTRLNTIAEQERAAVAAGDAVAEEAAFNAADLLNGELEAFRTRRISGATGVSEATINDLIRLAADDGALVERLLGRVSGDHAKVRQLLEVAGRDVNNLARITEMLDRFPAAAQPAGGVVADPRFAPLATDANMPHFLERHSIDHFDFNQVKASNSYFPRGTTPGEIADAIADTLSQIQRSGDRFPPNELRIKTLDAPPRLRGVTVQIVRDGGRIVQFFPLDGPGVVTFTRQEMTAIGRFLGRIT